MQASPEYFRNYREKNREKLNSWFREYNATKRKEAWGKVAVLKSGPCLDCGLSFASYAMEFDHRIFGDKVDDVSVMVKRNFSWGKILEEIEKCDLVCRRCHRLRSWTRQKEMSAGRPGNWRARTNRKKLDEIKKAPCSDCNESFLACQMDFDHVHGDKVSSISQMLRGPLAKLLLEIEKCELVCANCHATRTHSRLLGPDVDSL